MNRLIVVLLAAFVLTCTMTVAQAVEYVDIDQPDWDVGASSLSDWQQSFVPNVDNITAVSIYMTSGFPGAVEVQILDVVCGNILANGSTSGPGVGWVKCDFTGALALAPGNTYFIKVIAEHNFAASSLDPYSDGLLMYNCAQWSSGGHDLTFRTWADQDAVPEDQATWSTVKSIYR